MPPLLVVDFHQRLERRPPSLRAYFRHRKGREGWRVIRSRGKWVSDSRKNAQRWSGMGGFIKFPAISGPDHGKKQPRRTHNHDTRKLPVTKLNS